MTLHEKFKDRIFEIFKVNSSYEDKYTAILSTVADELEKEKQGLMTDMLIDQLVNTGMHCGFGEVFKLIHNNCITDIQKLLRGER